MAPGPGAIVSFVLFINFVTSDLSLVVILGSILSLVPEIFNDPVRSRGGPGLFLEQVGFIFPSCI